MMIALSKMLQEEDVEPFIIDLSTPCSTAPSSPIYEEYGSESPLDPKSNPHDLLSETDATDLPDLLSSLITPSKRETPDFLLETDGTNLLDFLFSPPPTPSLGLYETLLADPSPAARAAVLFYLKLTPVVQHNITTLVPPLLHDYRVMVSLATNIAYFNARGFIPEWELEYLLMQILVCPNPAGTNTSVLDPRITCLYHMTLDQINLYRAALVPQQVLVKQAEHERMLMQYNEERGRQRRCKAERATLALPWESHVAAGVPLPYGCATSAQLFMDVNEMYTCEAPPHSDWAQVRPAYNRHFRGRRNPPVKLPCKDADKLVPMDSEPKGMVTLQEDEMFSMSRVGDEELFAREENQGARFEIKLPDVTDRQ